MPNKLLLNTTLFLLFLFLLIGGMILAQSFLVPVCMAGLIATLLLPVTGKLENWGISRGWATLITILIVCLVLTGAFLLLSVQLYNLISDLPSIKLTLLDKLEGVRTFIEYKTNISSAQQLEYVKSMLVNSIESAAINLQGILTATTGTIFSASMVIVYTFFFLYYRDRLTKFLLNVIPTQNHEHAQRVIKQISKVTQQYISGIFTVISILAVLDTTGMLIIGIEHAIFFGVLAAMLNIIPYIGTTLGAVIPIVYTLITKDSIWYAVAVASMFAVIQFIENNFLTPTIVGSKVQINPLASVLAIILGGMIWGVAGMVLFIPFIGILKVVFDNVDFLKPYGYLIGESTSHHTASGKSWYGRIRDTINF